ncbi:MAG TPA: hypothetical protein VFD43_08675 [Planctomycetota bacterium]|nr:hypothetical protein [Planctomycetota bacterium]
MRLLLCALLLLPAACSGGDPAGSGASPAGSGAARHAAANVAPGSYEDWCGEHEVAESRCTRCDASLVAAFKATGDWCAEHGLPESQCVACDPGRKAVRPPKPEAR